MNPLILILTTHLLSGSVAGADLSDNDKLFFRQFTRSMCNGNLVNAPEREWEKQCNLIVQELNQNPTKDPLKLLQIANRMCASYRVVRGDHFPQCYEAAAEILRNNNDKNLIKTLSPLIDTNIREKCEDIKRAEIRDGRHLITTPIYHRYTACLRQGFALVERLLSEDADTPTGTSRQ